jgi:hypothetical protein
MSESRVEVATVIEARPEEVYAILTDYPGGHNAILPKPYFKEMIVTQGGQGAGTHITVHMEVYGAKRTLNMVVSEPEPGRILVEEDRAAGVHTTFTVEPDGAPDRTRVTITTRTQVASGLAGWLDKLISPSVTRMIYHKELANLAQFVQTKRAQAQTPGSLSL